VIHGQRDAVLTTVEHCCPLTGTKLYCLTWWQRYMCVVTWKWSYHDSNPQPLRRESNTLTKTPPGHTICLLTTAKSFANSNNCKCHLLIHSSLLTVCRTVKKYARVVWHSSIAAEREIIWRQCSSEQFGLSLGTNWILIFFPSYMMSQTDMTYKWDRCLLLSSVTLFTQTPARQLCWFNHSHVAQPQGLSSAIRNNKQILKLVFITCLVKFPLSDYKISGNLHILYSHVILTFLCTYICLHVILSSHMAAR